MRNCGTAEQWAEDREQGYRRCGSGRKVPAGEAALLERLEGDTETGVVDAQALRPDINHGSCVRSHIDSRYADEHTDCS